MDQWLQKCRGSIFLTLFCRTSLDATANSCRSYLFAHFERHRGSKTFLMPLPFTHFTPLVLVSFILHWCCRSIRSATATSYYSRSKANVVCQKNLICKIIYSKENNCGQKSCTTFWNHRQYFLAVLSIRKCNCCLLVFALKGQNNLVRKIFQCLLITVSDWACSIHNLLSIYLCFSYLAINISLF